MRFFGHFNTILVLISGLVLMFSTASCGQATGDRKPDTGSQSKAQQPFKVLTKEQIGDPCQWMTAELAKAKFSIENGTVDPPRSNTGITNTCELLIKGNGGGVALSWQLTTFDDPELYETSREVAEMSIGLQKLKTLKLGVIATISHQNAGKMTVSILQLHGSSYALNLTAQYQGTLNQDQIEKALVELAQVFLNKYP